MASFNDLIFDKLNKLYTEYCHGNSGMDNGFCLIDAKYHETDKREVWQKRNQHCAQCIIKNFLEWVKIQE
jgi:hypothetical protein